MPNQITVAPASNHPSAPRRRLQAPPVQGLRRDFPQLLNIGDALWSPSYFIASTGGAPLDRIKEYIQAQDRPD